MVRRIFLDFDDVLFDFTGRMLSLHGVSWDEAKEKWPPNGGLTIHRALGCTSRDLARALDSKASKVWAPDVRQPSWSQKLWSACSDTAHTVIVTKPTDWWRSVEPKVEWVRRKFGKSAADRLIFTMDRSSLAGPGHVLIDDSEQNCAKFTRAGGVAILFPRYHNCKHQIASAGGTVSMHDVLVHLNNVNKRTQEGTWP